MVSGEGEVGMGRTPCAFVPSKAGLTKEVVSRKSYSTMYYLILLYIV